MALCSFCGSKYTFGLAAQSTVAAVSPEPLRTLTSHQSEAEALDENMQTVTSRTAKIDCLGIIYYSGAGHVAGGINPPFSAVRRQGSGTNACSDIRF